MKGNYISVSLFTFIIAIFSCLGSTGSSGISTYLCLAGFLDTTSNSWDSVRGVRFLGVTENLFFSSFEISSPPKTLPHINLTIILQSFGDNWILLPPSAVLAWEGGGSPFSFSELSGESVDPRLPISPLSCNFKISNANQTPTKLQIWYMFYNATCVKLSRWNCTCTGCVSYFIIDKALLLFIRLYITYLDSVSASYKIQYVLTSSSPLETTKFLVVWMFNLQCKKNNNNPKIDWLIDWFTFIWIR